MNLAHMNTKYINDLYSQATYWHGTGRYKYGESGEIIDVLKGIIAEDGLIPHDDDWDWELGKIKSISFARARMYGRLYACMYVTGGKRIEGEHLPLWLWFHYFFDTARLLAFLDVSLWKLLRGEYQKRRGVWARKVTTSEVTDIYTIFNKGSDIVGNYPILIGVKNKIIQPLPGARIFNLHEARNGSSVGFKEMTHIEVPKEKVEETLALLKEAHIDTPVLPIEEGESYCRGFSFLKLVSGQSLCH
jgi:hypothetical protein